MIFASQTAFAFGKAPVINNPQTSNVLLGGTYKHVEGSGGLCRSWYAIIPHYEGANFKGFSVDFRMYEVFENPGDWATYSGDCNGVKCGVYTIETPTKYFDSECGEYERTSDTACFCSLAGSVCVGPNAETQPYCVKYHDDGTTSSVD